MVKLTHILVGLLLSCSAPIMHGQGWDALSINDVDLEWGDKVVGSSSRLVNALSVSEIQEGECQDCVAVANVLIDIVPNEAEHNAKIVSVIPKSVKIEHVVVDTVKSEMMDNMEDRAVMVGMRTGYNVAFGGYGALSLETTQVIRGRVAIRGGVQYSSFGKTSLEARPSYMIGLECGKVSPEVLIAYTNLLSVNSFAAGVGVSGCFGTVSGRLGYYYRTFGSLVNKEGQGRNIVEPFNVYYEVCIHLLRNIENWQLDLTITNNEIFELERHFQPSFIAECHYCHVGKMGLSFGIGCKLAGMFNMSADNYQTYIKTGVCYRW